MSSDFDRYFQKRRLVDKTGIDGGWALSLVWPNLFWDIVFNFELSLELRFLIDFNLNFNFNFNIELPTISFELPVKPEPAKYGEAIYGQDKYIPPDPPLGLQGSANADVEEGLRPVKAPFPQRAVEEALWKLSYKYTKHYEYDFNRRGAFLDRFRDAYEPILGKHISKNLYDNLLKRAEGVYQAGCFFDFNCFDLARFEPLGGFDAAKFDEDRFDEVAATKFRIGGSEYVYRPSETVFSTEGFDISLFDYARFDCDLIYQYILGTTLNADRHQEILDDFKLRADPLWMGTLWVLRSDEFKAKSVAAMSRNVFDYNRVKPILDAFDIPVQERWQYYAFLKEIAWYGRYRPIASREDIVEKYARLGLNRRCLETLTRLVPEIEKAVVGRRRA